MSLSAPGTSPNVPYVFGLENVCRPCADNAKSTRSGAHAAMAVEAHSFPVHLTNPAITNRARVIAAVNHTSLSGQVVTPQLSRHLAGYTAGVRIGQLPSV